MSASNPENSGLYLQYNIRFLPYFQAAPERGPKSGWILIFNTKQGCFSSEFWDEWIIDFSPSKR
jgi:hypothetical protein